MRVTSIFSPFPTICLKGFYLGVIKTWDCKVKSFSGVWKWQLSTKYNPFPNKPWFSCVYSRSLLKTLREKEKLLVTGNFSFSYSVFYPFGKLFGLFHQIWKCSMHHLSVWKGLKFVVWKGDNMKVELLLQYLYTSYYNLNVLGFRLKAVY